LIPGCGAGQEQVLQENILNLAKHERNLWKVDLFLKFPGLLHKSYLPIL